MYIIALICVLLKNFIYGISVFFTGELTSSVDVFDILALRFLISFFVLWILKSTKLLKIKSGIKDFISGTGSGCSKRDLFLAMMFEPVLYMLFETIGISMSTGITTAVILSLSPVTGCILESLILKEKTTFLQKIFLTAGTIGVIYIAAHTSSSEGASSFGGIIFLLFAVLSGSLYAVFTRRASAVYSSIDRTYIYNLFGMISFNCINIIRHLCNGTLENYFVPLADINNLIGFGFLAIISAIIAALLGNFALSRVQVSTSGAFAGVSTVVTVAAGALFANEKIYYYHIIGISLILIRSIGVSVIASKKNKSCSGK